ncbi:MAG: hypothetical protein K9K66_02360 [Desulfarculaceae bacterium]|nr:hypothetical protein [Desulfarculaceae bacterium]MCF8070891.1 hypothetical protein [Desulfarculaceae bacterium]MCF8100479.1 hypothetical protein [Desulfarculaceae bacterium]MCF8118086.1 hypothetical protein [Desulfarculaceae bacterium]
MGTCRYCGEAAGFLRSKHPECHAKFLKEVDERNEALNKISVLAEKIINEEMKLDEFKSTVAVLANTHNFTEEQKRDALIKGWEQCVDKALEDSLLSEEEEDSLADYYRAFDLSQQELNRNDAFTQVVKAGVLRDLVQGEVNPERMKIQGDLPFNFMKSEKLIWVFTNTDYYEEKTRRQYVGGHAGVSVRVVKGVYFRTGSFKGHPVETKETVYIGKGLLAVTTKHVYFSGGGKSFRIRHNKIVTIEPHSDGVTVQRDAATAKPQSFATGDGWFTYNLLANVANLE